MHIRRKTYKKHYKRKSYKRKSFNKKTKTYKKYNRIRGGGHIKKKTMNKLQTLLTNPDERKSLMLSKICNVSTRGACLDFGVYKEQINNFFEKYSINTTYPKYIKKI